VTEALGLARYKPEHVLIPNLQPPALVIKPDRTEVADDKDLVVTLTATPRGGHEFNRPDHWFLWVGDHRFRDSQWQPVAGQYQAQVKIPYTTLRQGVNRLTLQGFSKGGSSEKVVVRVRRVGPPVQPRLFVTVVGVADYSRARAGTGIRLVDLPGI